MHIGDLVIADHPESESSILTRFYGIVLEIGQTGRVIIELADGSVIEKTNQFNRGLRSSALELAGII